MYKRQLFTLAGLSLTGFIGTLIVVRPIAVRRASMRDDWGLLRSRKRLLKIARKAQVVRGERPTQPKAKHEVKAERLAKARAKGERLPSLSDLYHNGVAEYCGDSKLCDHFRPKSYPHWWDTILSQSVARIFHY